MKKALLALSLLALLVGAGTAHAKPSLSADLTGAAEVGGGDPDGSGYVLISLSPATNRLCFGFVVNGIAPATAAHIHRGPVGANGPVVVTLIPPTDGSSMGCVLIDPELLKDLRANSDQYYVNVHNAEYPGGAIRGQLAH
jgi:hypothetical protein